MQFTLGFEIDFQVCHIIRYGYADIYMKKIRKCQKRMRKEYIAF
jgi:hypothetical protein